LAAECEGKELNENFADPESVTGYYSCAQLLGGVDVVPMHHECPEGQAFLIMNKACGPFLRSARSADVAKCPEGQKWNFDTQSCQTVHLAAECEGKELNENFADPESVTGYYSCAQLLGGVDVVPVHHECPEGQAFLKMNKACGPFLRNAAPRKLTTNPCFGKNLNENFADPESKTSYYFCNYLIGGSAIVPMHRDCPEGKVFVATSKSCE